MLVSISLALLIIFASSFLTSLLVSPIITLTKKGNNAKTLTPLTTEASLQQKHGFAPVLHHPDPCRPFFLEVDTSSVELGEVLSQKITKGKILVTSGLFPKTFSPAEKYDSI